MHVCFLLVSIIHCWLYFYIKFFFFLFFYKFPSQISPLHLQAMMFLHPLWFSGFYLNNSLFFYFSKLLANRLLTTEISLSLLSSFNSSSFTKIPCEVSFKTTVWSALTVSQYWVFHPLSSSIICASMLRWCEAKMSTFC